ncbi:MAG: outer membrane beta-barrel protein [Verrucomicrobia bacterium]|nr:outer membrane beta-barrel protein [Verrucomicrobiota bacterium]
MKFNKWTVALAALGVVSFASAAKAEEKASPVMTALAATTISGYVDTSAEWNPGTGNANLPPYRFNSNTKADGFNLDVIQLTISKPLDESDWAAGYRADLWFGPDANSLGTSSTGVNSSDFAIRQGYVALRAPVGTGLDFKMGVFDSIIGYESLEAGNNPNFTRSYGNSIEPTTHTGLLASYRFCDAFSASAGVADTVNAPINGRAQNGSSGVTSGPFQGLWNYIYANNDQGITQSTVQGYNSKSESYKTYMGSVALTAPDSMGFMSGSTLYAGIINGYNSSVWGTGIGSDQTSWYVGGTMATPVTGLRLGAAFDYLNYADMGRDTPLGRVTMDPYALALAGYISYQATEKLSFHERLEYTEEKFDLKLDGQQPQGEHKAKIVAFTSTVQYDLWKNVITRLEFRVDHSATGNNMFGGSTAGVPDRINAYMLAANVIYKF